MAAVGNDGQRLATILAEMIRSALAWEQQNGTPRDATNRDGPDGVDGIHRPYTLSLHSGVTKQSDNGGEP